MTKDSQKTVEEVDARRVSVEKDRRNRAAVAFGGDHNARHSANLLLFTGVYKGVVWESGQRRTDRTVPDAVKSRYEKPRRRNGSR